MLFRSRNGACPGMSHYSVFYVLTTIVSCAVETLGPVQSSAQRRSFLDAQLRNNFLPHWRHNALRGLAHHGRHIVIPSVLILHDSAGKFGL